MAGRIRTCGAPRFRRPLYRLSYGHALSGRGWTRTSSLLCVKQALFALELLARGAPGQGLEPRSPRSERRVLPDWTIPDCVPNHVVYATRLPFDPGSPRRDVLRGGALEPGALALSGNCQAKAAAYSAANCRARIAQRNLSLSGGASNSVFASQAGHHPSVRGWFLLLIRRRRPSRVALASSSYAAKQLARIPPGEGFAVLRRALVTTRLLPAGSHDGGRRVGKERVGV